LADHPSQQGAQHEAGMNSYLFLLTALASLVLASQVGKTSKGNSPEDSGENHLRQSGLLGQPGWAPHFLSWRPYQCVWAAALGWIGIQAACRFFAAQVGWSPGLYRLWFLSSSVFPFAYIGGGLLYRLVPYKIARLSTTLLLVASLAIMGIALGTPIGADPLLAGAPRSLRLAASLFSLYGLFMIVVGALGSAWKFIWDGANRRSASAALIIALGALGLAAVPRVSPLAAPFLPLAAIAILFIGFRLASRPVPHQPLSVEQLKRRRLRITTVGLGFSVTTILGLVAVLPLMPVYMGIWNKPFKSVYIQQVPDENNGVYMITDQGVMQAYSWSIQPDDFPSDSPALDYTSVQKFVVVSKVFDDPQNYTLFNITTGEQIRWMSISQQGVELTLDPGPLQPGQYELDTPTDSMFGGDTYQYFTLK
jgi:hypothetical protein